MNVQLDGSLLVLLADRLVQITHICMHTHICAYPYINVQLDGSLLALLADRLVQTVNRDSVISIMDVWEGVCTHEVNVMCLYTHTYTHTIRQ
jgi:hypothetical protein